MLTDLYEGDLSATEMAGVREHVEEYPVVFVVREDGKRVLRAFNEATYNCTEIDFDDLLIWIKCNGEMK